MEDCFTHGMLKMLVAMVGEGGALSQGYVVSIIIHLANILFDLRNCLIWVSDRLINLLQSVNWLNWWHVFH